MIPRLLILAGPNGAGKTTSAPWLAARSYGIHEHVNADAIAAGISAFRPEHHGMRAGRLMIERLRELAHEGHDFSIETTLSSRTLAVLIRQIQDERDYEVHLLFLWLKNEELAIRRVATRVAMGGHAVPDDTIRRRYRAGLRNFFELYHPMAVEWSVWDNSSESSPHPVASGSRSDVNEVHDPTVWQEILRFSHD